MANKDWKSLKNLSKNELQMKLNELQSGVFQAQLKKSTGQLEDVALVWRLKKSLARVKTLLGSSTVK